MKKNKIVISINKKACEIANGIGHEQAYLNSLKIIENLQSQIKQCKKEKNKILETNLDLAQLVEKSVLLVKNKSDFLSSMSHEIRTPLNGILGIAEIISQSELSSQDKEYVDLLSYSGQKLLTIINEILDFSKIESGQMRVNNQEFDLDVLISSVKANFSLQAESKGIQFFIESTENVPSFIVGDETRIFQILSNVIGNALKFTKEGYIKVLLDARKSKNVTKELFVVITDTGIGMNQDGLSKVFTPFEQADLNTDRYFGGTGLGLSIVKKVLNLINGTIEVESELGEGTKFKITLPYEEVEIKSESHLVHTLLPSNAMFQSMYKYTILVAEDNIVNKKVINGFLVKLGYKPEFANNGLEVLDALKYKSYDIILMDMMMPELGGVEATEIIRKKNLGEYPYIIALTASATAEDEEKCLDSGMNGFLTKPVTLMAIKKTISEIKELKKEIYE